MATWWILTYPVVEIFMILVGGAYLSGFLPSFNFIFLGQKLWDNLR